MMPKQMTLRNVSYLLFNVLTLIVFFVPLRELLVSSWNNELYSHIVLIPVISGYILYIKRKNIFSNAQYNFVVGIGLIVIGTLPYFIEANQGHMLNQNDALSLAAFSFVTFWTGGFIFCFGLRTFRNALFPVLFLVFMIPIPTFIVERIVYVLQSGSAEVSYGIFKLTGVPILREGFVFHLPGLSVEVAEQCSGIRSSLALFITSVIAGHIFLKTGWKKVILSLSIFPITVVKNGVRIVTLSLLGNYVDERILTQSILHRKGGIPFFIMALALFVPVLWGLRKSERKDS